MNDIIYNTLIIIAIVTFHFLVYRKMILLNYNIVKLRIFIILSVFAGFFASFIGTRLATMFYLPKNYWSINAFFNSIYKKEILTYHSGVIVGFVILSILFMVFRFNFFETYDVYFLYLPVAHAIGRIGCLISGCCWGNLISISIFDKIHTFHNPVPIYSITLNILIFILLNQSFNHVYNINDKNLKGLVMALYLILYGIIRFILEIFRTEKIVFSVFTQAQVVMSFFAIIGFILLLFIFIRKNVYKQIFS
jgi:phosphatidylglycerol---prolipoprotein diacylglyceryl transferase